jgi:imidazolonepropionase-like amidohydrolase
MKRLVLFTVLGLATAAPLQAQTRVPTTAPAEQTVVIHAGTLLAVPGSPARRQVSVVVQGRKIVGVRDGFVDMPGARIVDLRDSTVLPGLIDMHVHLRSMDDRLQARLQENQLDYEDTAYTALLNARKTLLAGFTTVRDLGGNPRMITSLRDAISAGSFAGPTIVAAGLGVSVTGGHGFPVNGVNRTLEGAIRPGMTNGADDCRRAVREQISAGADVIKFAATGGVLSNVAGGLNKQMMDDEMRAIVETARSFGRKVAAHAHGVDGVNAALAAGVDSIEHGTFTNDQTFALYKKSGAYYVPTLLAPAAALADGERGALTPAQHRFRHRYRSQPPRPQRRGIRFDGGCGHDSRSRHSLGDGRCGNSAWPRRHGGNDRGGQRCRHHRGAGRSSAECAAARKCRLRDEARPRAQA